MYLYCSELKFYDSIIHSVTSYFNELYDLKMMIIIKLLKN